MLHKEKDNLKKGNKLNEYIRVGEAAATLGVHPDTLRRWERIGKLVSYRHPLNQYRLYRIEDLQALLLRVSQP